MPRRHWFESVARLKSQIRTLILAYRHADTPIYAKIWLVLVLGYALSPLDLIPDFIPIVGYLDDLILIAIGIYIALKLIPEAVMVECREADEMRAYGTRVGWLGTGVILLIWASCLVMVIHLASGFI